MLVFAFLASHDLYTLPELAGWRFSLSFKKADHAFSLCSDVGLKTDI
jgi:hypothetical protein